MFASYRLDILIVYGYLKFIMSRNDFIIFFLLPHSFQAPLHAIILYYREWHLLLQGVITWFSISNWFTKLY